MTADLHPVSESVDRDQVQIEDFIQRLESKQESAS